MYNAADIYKDELNKGGAKIPMGIHSECDVVNIEKGENFVDINFKKTVEINGETKETKTYVHNKRLWEPNGNYPRDGETKAEALEREATRNMSHIVHIAHLFLGKDELNKISGNTYDDFMTNAIKVLTPDVLKKHKVNLKLIYDSDGIYSTFGNFPDYLELYVEGKEPELKYTKWELENRTTPKEAIRPSGEGFADLL